MSHCRDATLLQAQEIVYTNLLVPRFVEGKWATVEMLLCYRLHCGDGTFLQTSLWRWYFATGLTVEMLLWYRPHCGDATVVQPREIATPASLWKMQVLFMTVHDQCIWKLQVMVFQMINIQVDQFHLLLLFYFFICFICPFFNFM